MAAIGSVRLRTVADAVGPGGFRAAAGALPRTPQRTPSAGTAKPPASFGRPCATSEFGPARPVPRRRHLTSRAVSEDDAPEDEGVAGGDEASDDRDAVVERLRDEVQAARERVREAWNRYRNEAGSGPAAAVVLVLMYAL